MILDGIAEFNFFAGKFSHFQQFLKHTILLLFQRYKKSHFQKIKYYNIKSIVYQYYINSGKIFTRWF
jgi:hypothetical protein